MLWYLSDTLVSQGAFASHAAPADTDILHVRTHLSPRLSVWLPNAADAQPREIAAGGGNSAATTPLGGMSWASWHGGRRNEQ